MSLNTTFTYLINAFRDGGLHHLCRQPVPNPFREENIPSIQSKLPWEQLESTASCALTSYLREETNTHLSATSFQVVEGIDGVSPEPQFLQVLLLSIVF